MSRRRNRSHRRESPHRSRSREGARKAGGSATGEVNRNLLTRRNWIIGSVAGTVLAGAGLYFGSIRKDEVDEGRGEDSIDRVVFDETNGKPERKVECFRQIHSSRELVQIILNNPDVVDYYVRHHQGILRKLLEQHRKDPSTLYLLEGCNEEGKKAILEDQQRIEQIVSIDQVIETNLLGMIEGIRQTLQRFPVDSGNAILHYASAPLRFLVRNRNNTPNIHGTEPDDYEMLDILFRREIERLVQLDRQNKMTRQELIKASKMLNEKAEEDNRTRHTHITDVIDKEVRPGQKAQLVLGSGHFRSGVLSKTNEDPLENYLTRLKNTRVRVIDEAHLGGSIQAIPKRLTTVTPEALDMTIRQLREGQ